MHAGWAIKSILQNNIHIYTLAHCIRVCYINTYVHIYAYISTWLTKHMHTICLCRIAVTAADAAKCLCLAAGQLWLHSNCKRAPVTVTPPLPLLLLLLWWQSCCVKQTTQFVEIIKDLTMWQMRFEKPDKEEISKIYNNSYSNNKNNKINENKNQQKVI